MIEYSGGGDPTRSMALLWREAEGAEQRPRRGPRPRLSIAAVIGAAIELADAEGIEALSMRKVAERLGVPVMSLYTYVPGKAELTDLMLDTVYAETAKPEPAPEAGWRSRLEQVARENWALCRRHPWMLHIVTYRPPLGPNLIAKYDYELSTVDGLGLSDVEMDSALTLVLGFVHGAARSAVEAAQAERHTGITDEQWWEANAPLLQRVLEPSRYPVAARVGAAAGEAYGGVIHPEHAFEFGLQRVLDGIEALLGSRADG